MTDPDDLVARLQDNHRVFGDCLAGNLFGEAAAEIERLRAELASGSFYKESDIDALQDEIERLCDLLGRLCIYFGECEGTDYIEADGRPSYPRSDAITDAEAKEIARYRDAARAKMEGEG